MLNNWKTYNLSEILEIKYGKDHKKLEEGNIPVYGTGGIMRYANKFLYDKESILIPRKGSLNNIYYINEPFWTVDTLFWSKVNYGLAFPRFVFYKLKVLDFANMDVGSAIPSLTTNLLNNLKISLPPLPEQQAIASILSTIDEQIENNLAMNKTLEEMAMALYKHWFVDFGPFQEGNFVESELGEIPEGWKVSNLEEQLEIKYGKDHKKLNEGNIPVYGTGGIMRYVDTALYEDHSILIPRKGSLGNVYYISEPFWTVDTLFYSKIKNSSYRKYLFYVVKNMNLISMDVGSAIPSLTTALLKRLRIVVPSEEVANKFEVQISEYFDLMNNNKIENQTLVEQRESLLPKLVSGEVRVKGFG